jgi:hypothetical protein
MSGELSTNIYLCPFWHNLILEKQPEAEAVRSYAVEA